jgi:hypothetical protein
MRPFHSYNYSFGRKVKTVQPLVTDFPLKMIFFCSGKFSCYLHRWPMYNTVALSTLPQTVPLKLFSVLRRLFTGDGKCCNFKVSGNQQLFSIVELVATLYFRKPTPAGS